nr:hypothetical protein [Escherichia coli]
MFAGKKSAQIREILISESAWEEMTCLFAPSLVVGVISGAVYLYNLAISLFDSNPTSVQFTFCGVGCFIALLLQWISNVDANYRERIGEQPSTIKNIVQYLFAAIITISFITMALTAILVLKDSSNIWLNITFIALLLSIFVAIISVWG